METRLPSGRAWPSSKRPSPSGVRRHAAAGMGLPGDTGSLSSSGTECGRRPGSRSCISPHFLRLPSSQVPPSKGGIQGGSSSYVITSLTPLYPPFARGDMDAMLPGATGLCQCLRSWLTWPAKRLKKHWATPVAHPEKRFASPSASGSYRAQGSVYDPTSTGTLR
jgi:hypothetical protein